MNSLPIVTVTRADGGHALLCTCGWEAFRYGRPAADEIAIDHRASHGKRGH